MYVELWRDGWWSNRLVGRSWWRSGRGVRLQRRWRTCCQIQPGQCFVSLCIIYVICWHFHLMLPITDCKVIFLYFLCENTHCRNQCRKPNMRTPAPVSRSWLHCSVLHQKLRAEKYGNVFAWNLVEISAGFWCHFWVVWAIFFMPENIARISLSFCLCTQTCGESVTAVQGGCVGSAEFAEVLCCTYGGQGLCFCHKLLIWKILRLQIAVLVAMYCWIAWLFAENYWLVTSTCMSSRYQ